MRELAATRIVVKIGTSTLIHPNGKLNLIAIDQLCYTLSGLVNEGKQVVLVSSGAIGAGLGQLGMTQRPAAIPEQQAIAAIGQTELMTVYQQRFSMYGQKIGQILLTHDVVDFPTSRENVLNTFESLLKAGVIPIVNENDTVAVDELDHHTRFGDNDQLSALVATAIKADLLVMLSDIEGFYDKNPRKFTDATLIKQVKRIDEQLFQHAGGSGTRLGTGGMTTKLKAAQMMLQAGSSMILASGKNPSIIFKLIAGEEVGTLFSRITKEELQVISELEQIGQQAKQAAFVLGQLATTVKNQALLAMAQALRTNQAAILAANQQDLQLADKLPAKFIDRLRLTSERINQMAQGMEQVANLPDPIGVVERGWVNHAGLQIVQQHVPLGVIGIIYEARPNVTADAAALCFKSGNAVILRGGKEALKTNLQVGAVMQQALSKLNLPANAIQVISDPAHETANQLMQLTDYVDVLIPRGSSRLIQAVVQHATVPVIETGAGNCHVYVDQSADFAMAEKIILNAKCQRPSVCNAMEKLLVHEKIAADFLPELATKLTTAGVEIRGDQAVQQILGAAVVPATMADWKTEYNDLILAVKVVPSMETAIEHINQYGTKHSETIITQNYENSERFLSLVDAAAVYVNASSRFTDGFEYGFGAEIGISTQKLHARGPMGLPELTTTKYLVRGNGQIRK